MSFPAALSELTILPRYVKSLTLSSGMESTVMECAVGVLSMNVVCLDCVDVKAGLFGKAV